MASGAREVALNEAEEDIMARTRKWDVRRGLKGLEAWLTPENRALLRDRPRLELETELLNHEPYTLGLIAVDLSHLAIWENSAGVYAVLCGDQAGWSQLRLGLAYEGWNLKIRYGKFQRDLAQGREVDVTREHWLAARCLALAIALRDDAFADWCGQRLLHGATSSDRFFRDWDATPFHPFMARLYALWRGCAIDTKEGPLRDAGLYQPLLDHWHDEDRYAAALLQACDYHCARSVSSMKEYREFWQTPFLVFPAEILAVQRVRQELLGSAPAVSHPLLDTPLGRVPASIVLPHDELLQRVIARVQADLSGPTEADPKQWPGASKAGLVDTAG
jgi:hypothetical protein